MNRPESEFAGVGERPGRMTVERLCGRLRKRRRRLMKPAMSAATYARPIAATAPAAQVGPAGKLPYRSRGRVRTRSDTGGECLILHGA
jgi:hypothetical protein